MDQPLADDAEELLPLLGEDAGLVCPAVLRLDEIPGGQPRLVHDVLITQHDLFGLRHLLRGFAEAVGKGVGIKIRLRHHDADLFEAFGLARPDAFQHRVTFVN